MAMNTCSPRCISCCGSLTWFEEERHGTFSCFWLSPLIRMHESSQNRSLLILYKHNRLGHGLPAFWAFDSCLFYVQEEELLDLPSLFGVFSFIYRRVYLLWTCLVWCCLSAFLHLWLFLWFWFDCWQARLPFLSYWNSYRVSLFELLF